MFHQKDTWSFLLRVLAYIDTAPHLHLGQLFNQFSQFFFLNDSSKVHRCSFSSLCGKAEIQSHSLWQHKSGCLFSALRSCHVDHQSDTGRHSRQGPINVPLKKPF